MVFAVVLGWWAMTARYSQRQRGESSPLRAAVRGAVLGAAIHIKGPQASVLPVIGVGGALWFDRWFAPRNPAHPPRELGYAVVDGFKRHAIELLVLAAFAGGIAELTLQWSESHSGSQQVRAYLWRESVTRAADPFDHTGSPLLYAWVLPVMLLPVLAMAPLWALGAAPVDPNARRSRLARQALGWAAVTVLFFLIIPSRRSYYILPAIPPLALWLATLAARWADSRPAGGKTLRQLAISGIVVMALVFAAAMPAFDRSRTRRAFARVDLRQVVADSPNAAVVMLGTGDEKLLFYLDAPPLPVFKPSEKGDFAAWLSRNRSDAIFIARVADWAKTFEPYLANLTPPRTVDHPMGVFEPRPWIMKPVWRTVAREAVPRGDGDALMAIYYEPGRW
jgi:4-amino-4-deoxy-L-arabinose transferase-like glycosyltransferase